MKNTITRVDALNFAIDTIQTYRENDTAVIEVLSKIRDNIAKPRTTSDEAKAKRKEKNVQARAALMEQVLPVLRDALSKFNMGVTAKELYENCTNTLPADFTVNKVQYILLHEMKDEVEKVETKNKPNVYRIKRV